MKSLWNSFTIAIAMYSKIPIKTADWNKNNMKYVMCFFPFVGVIIGICLVAVFQLLNNSGFGTLFSTAILVLIPPIITGGIHLDGLLDTADALSSYQSKERKLEILKDSHAGAFAIIVGICYFVLTFGVWSEVSEKTIYVLAISFVLSRALSGFAVVTFPCAKDSGLARTFSDAASKKKAALVMCGFIIFCIIFMVVCNVVAGTLAVIGGLVTFIYYRHMSMKQFGGITGDLAGYFLQLCELVMALFAMIGGML